ncbi:thrombospondin-2-like isoform X2 [Physella acuta]|uniref:thrombospondin-2-like isoform X2 n=1 Tax=Physella acuta TaxID=109671 RepID=UPI0027DDBBE5|nr:thrombospondin-2-like isoform X2 [Physella acuta]
MINTKTMTVDFLLFSTLLHLILTFGFCYAKSEGHWGEWGAQSPCSVTCGSGTQTIERVWIPGSGESSERYKSIQTFTCTDPKFPECPRDGAWSAWGAWNECSKPCGGGEKERIRECLGITAGGKKCDGESLSKEPCNKDPCPRDTTKKLRNVAV